MGSKDKAKKSKSGDKAHKKKHRSSEPAAAAPEPAEPAGDPESAAARASADFEAGLLFARYDRNATGRLGKLEFSELIRDLRGGPSPAEDAQAPAAAPAAAPAPAQPTVVCDACTRRVPCRLYCYQCGRSTCADCDSAMHAVPGWQAHRRVMEGAGQYQGVPRPQQASAAAAAAGGFASKHMAPHPTGSLGMAHTAMLGLRPELRAHAMGRPVAAPAAPPPPLQHCQLHAGMELDFFCDSCGLAICPACCTQGAHVGQGHLVRPLREVYGQCLAELQGKLSAVVYPKREEVLMHVQRTAAAMEQVRATKLRVERETLEDQRHILQALAAAESTKLGTLQRDLDQLQADLHAIDHCVGSLPQQFAGSAPLVGSSGGGGAATERAMGMVELVQFYPDLCGILERIGQTPVHTPAVVDLEFPRVAAKRSAAAQELQQADRRERAAAQLLETKDQLIWSLLQERREAIERENALRAQIKRLSDEAAEEIGEWAALAESLGRG